VVLPLVANTVRADQREVLKGLILPGPVYTSRSDRCPRRAYVT